METKHLPYRHSVVGVFVDHRGKVLVLERIDTPRAWQFPQGGVESGESEEAGLVREMNEELGCSTDFSILRKGENLTYYDFPASLQRPIAQHFRGQKARWFLCRFGSIGVDLSRASHREFTALRWVTSMKAHALTIAWKKDAYRQGLMDLGLIGGDLNA